MKIIYQLSPVMHRDTYCLCPIHQLRGNLSLCLSYGLSELLLCKVKNVSPVTILSTRFVKHCGKDRSIESSLIPIQLAINTKESLFGLSFYSAESEGFKPPIPAMGIPDFESSAFDHSANFPLKRCKIMQ